MRRSMVLVLALALSACGSLDTDGEPDGSGPLVIVAAASLHAAFDDLADAFTERFPQYRVAPIEYDGSQALAVRLLDGAEVDVVAFADEMSLRPVTDAGIVEGHTIFATNTLRIAVPPGNPRSITTLQDLADPDLAVVLCAPDVPCGAASEALLDAAGVHVRPVSQETNVTSVLNRVAWGEADAGLVYATDVAASAGRVDGVTPPNADTVVNRYPIAVASAAPSAASAHAFVEFVMSRRGRAILAAHGFGAP